MRKITLKSVLMTALLAMSANAMAGETVTSFDFEDGTHPFAIFDANRIAASIVDDADLSSKALHFTCGNMNQVAFAYYDFSSLMTGASKVTVEFDFNVATVAGHALISLSDASQHTGSAGGFTGKSNTGYGANGAIFNLGCVRGGGTQKFAINTTQTDKEGLDAWCHAKVVVDLLNKKVDYTITKAGEILVSDINLNYLNGSATTCSQIDVYIGTNATGNSVNLDNLTITPYVDESATFADYTVNFYDADADAVVKSDTRNGQVGAAISLTDKDKEAFYSEDGNTKYTYVSDDAAEKTITAEGTVVTLTVKAESKVAYKLAAVVGGAELATIEEGEAFAGEKTVYWSKYINVEDKWYVTEAPYGTTITEAGTTEVVYVPADIAYFSEAEAMTTSHSAAATAAGTQYSGGNSHDQYASASLTTGALAAGVYNVHAEGFSRRSGSTKIDIVVVTVSTTIDESENVIEVETETETGLSLTWTNTGVEAIQMDALGVEVPEGAKLRFKEATGYNSVTYLDYIMLTPFAADQVSFVLGESESFASYVPSYAADFKASGVTAYVATAAVDGVVTLESVEAVPAGTPVLVKGTKGATVEIKKAAAAEAPAANLLKAATGAVLNENQYVLAYTNEEFIFAHLDGAIELPAGKVYLEVEGAGEVKAFRIAGTATAVESVKAAQADGRIFNLAGQRVNKAQKGIYVVNGKKIVK